MTMIARFSAVLTLALGMGQAASAQDASELAQQLANPIASLISVPFQFNYDEGHGSAGTGRRTTVNLQPVVPFSIGDNWNVISRTIIPIIDQTDVIPGTSQSGLGDVLQSFFFSPKAPTAGGMIWGVGPVFLLPTAEQNLGRDQFAAGITGIALKQTGPWTYGMLANHLWDFGGGSTDIDATFVQPFISYNTANAWTFSLTSEATYDWVAKDTSLPINFNVAKLVQIAGQPVSIGGGVRYWADTTTNGPDGWGARLTVTFLYPR